MHEKKLVMRAAVAALLAMAAVGAQAQTAGTWFGGIGATRIAPNTKSGTLSPPSAPGTMVDVGPDTQPTLFVGRMLTDNWSVEVPIGFGFKHTITGSGAIGGVGTIGTVKALPVSVFAQYRFMEPGARFRPYVMLGLTYAYFYDEQGSAALNGVNPINPPGGTALSVDSRWGIAPGLGVTAMINDRWFVDLQYARSFLRTTTTLSSGQSISTRLNPDVYRIAVGMRF
jgi:outer membrane protein